ncbi:MAG: AAA family ATPase, partial [Candidatus Kerfeldbacteria bacterium]|nr:AAA family ATPase [Candidatus Kerfeldbacteria bacterium]
KSITTLKPEARAKLGIFLSFQHPAAVPGVSVANLVRTSYKHLAARSAVDVKAFRARMQKVLENLHMKPDMLDRSVNDGFSGGEKKLTEMLQLAMLRPKLILLDEIDSGLDLDALKRMSDLLASLRSFKRAFLLITHNPRILKSIRADVVHVFHEGKIVQTGAAGLVREVEQNGFERILA